MEAALIGADVGTIPKQLVSFEDLLMSQIVPQEALTRLLIEKRIFTQEEFLKMVSQATDLFIQGSVFDTVMRTL